MITPQTEAPDLATALGIPKLYLKREDLHPLGSHKGRSIPVMIDVHAAQGKTDFIISSSGNAALAAIRHIQAKNIERAALPTPAAPLTLSVLVGEHIDADKKQRLLAEIAPAANADVTTSTRITVTESRRPLQALFEAIKGEKKTSLRQSVDGDALIGYESLANELARTPDLESVFIPTSSGTAAQAIAEYFNKNGKAAGVHMVQTNACHPLVEAFDAPNESDPSAADAIVDKTAYRRQSAVEAVAKGKGSGWIPTGGDLARARELLVKSGVEATNNGALGLAGLIRAISKGQAPKGAAVVVITGR